MKKAVRQSVKNEKKLWESKRHLFERKKEKDAGKKKNVDDN